MTETRKLKELWVDESLYPRNGLDQALAARYVEAMRAGQSFPPLVVNQSNNQIVDGRHRHEAYKRFWDGDVERSIEVELRIFRDKAELLLAAVSLNTIHGQPLEPFEVTSVLLRLEALGVSRQQAASALRITFEKAEKIFTEKTAIRVLPGGEEERVALKSALHYLAGSKLAPKQAEFNRRAGGMSFRYYIEQVIGLIEIGAMKRADEETLKRLRHLTALLKDRLPLAERKSAEKGDELHIRNG